MVSHSFQCKKKTEDKLVQVINQRRKKRASKTMILERYGQCGGIFASRGYFFCFVPSIKFHFTITLVLFLKKSFCVYETGIIIIVFNLYNISQWMIQFIHVKCSDMDHTIFMSMCCHYWYFSY